MQAFEIISPGLLSSIQDFGRKGYAYYAIPSSGALDKSALIRANKILGNPENTAVIEFNFMPAVINFLGDCSICLSGADMQFSINNKPVQMNKVIDINEGDILKGKWSKHSARSYMALKGVIDCPEIYGSYSSLCNNSINSHLGRSLKKGDILNWNNLELSNFQTVDLAQEELNKEIKINKGPEWNSLDQNSKEKLLSTKYSISTQSNRMGARLNEKLHSHLYQELKSSVPVIPGFIQWTPAGDLIVLLQDGQTTGGYPRIAYIQEKELSRFNQIGGQEKFHFAFQQ